MARNTSNWESDFWYSLSRGDGVHYPLYQDCNYRKQQGWCWDDYQEPVRQILDNARLDERANSLPRHEHGNYSQLSLPLELMANKFISDSNIHCPPVPDGLVHRLDINRELEIYQIPLKTVHGAAWYCTNRWVVHLNKKDTHQMKRFTLFHEAFHMMARSKFGIDKHTGAHARGRFIEGMADTFATYVLIPTAWAKEQWFKSRDVATMAAMFDVPESVMWFRLRHLGLV
ncbi:MAG: ImmA/IrrE family metallo-endopeptidase [Dehalococcoidales bacterium]|nr:ImmA/IrrE family metallo-endopeptidase [Dehalococcoidales bacterium]